ncbi:CAMK/CAMKL/AMPK protein kinase [Spizellomyces punctatus DAOM BR117]|uniref:non-specific serine/threonine protein kinase n=1 Tax=Spizellomyces punctatus (strain DAOM BR117) TaxID=645134 RepID=A0A0L0HKE4_SPIPD|nr:CAMK/CAMKL/AMPK protein kinase [Spizellomyces punctatus DAOM BR117]KND01365.1 CAMK/CAMKL/AMPK protein kinase [Spizellomyces punctatus DAOM BR117]|eukprot:XP_016609404.1 CAMK/CAMKL/AMPK protein kinase [Spizellomyces punctatus DAOM BR117]
MASTQIKVGNYTLLETLGVGSFGKVKLAVHAQTGHKVALKIINRRRIANMDMVGRVKREIQYLKLLRHPHIIKLYEVITTPTDIIMVMEYAGGELFNYIVNRGRMSEDDARRFFQQIICAVEYCHRHKIVHRDLKPENVLLDEYDQVKIADFGLSNIMSDGEFLKTSCGSPNYAAPEVINGKLYAGPEVDVWSCGVILYVMLCGRLPFDDDYIPALFKKINGGIFSLPTFLSPPVKSLLQAMLIVDPLKRITISQIRESDWFQKGLPDYLNPLPSISVVDSGLDSGVVEEVARRMGLSSETVRVALGEEGNNQVKVACELVLDHRRMVAGVRHSPNKTIHHYLLSESPPAWNAPTRKPPPQPTPTPDPPSTSSIHVLPSSLPREPIPRRHKTRSKWHFGIRSRSAPFDIMLEIYKALKSVGMRWRAVDVYHIRAVMSGNHNIKLDIQLYQVEQHNYLVDFKNASGEGCMTVFGFFEACGRLITELAISG